jgi:hypothetical protein
MKTSLFPLFLLFATSLHAQEGKPDAGELVREVRHSQAGEEYTMKGELIKGRKTAGFTMSTVPDLDMIRFKFDDPIQIISLVLKPNRAELTEQVVGQPAKPLAEKRYGEKIQGTDVTYEDISQRFLYWPNPKIVDDEKERISLGVRRDAWKVRLDNPRPGLGPYRVVMIWVDKESKALLRVDGYDDKGRKIKRFEVSKVRKDEGIGIWVLEKMRVFTIDQKGDEKEETVMKMDKPTRP